MVSIQSIHYTRFLHLHSAAASTYIFPLQLSDGSFNSRGLSVSRYLDMAKALSNRKPALFLLNYTTS